MKVFEVSLPGGHLSLVGSQLLFLFSFTSSCGGGIGTSLGICSVLEGFLLILECLSMLSINSGQLVLECLFVLSGFFLSCSELLCGFSLGILGLFLPALHSVLSFLCSLKCFCFFSFESCDPLFLLFDILLESFFLFKSSLFPLFSLLKFLLGGVGCCLCFCLSGI